MTLAHELAERIHRIRYDDLPPAVLEWTRAAFVDTIAVTLAGITTDTVQVPVLGLYAGKDGHITADDVTAMKVALKGTKSDIVVYPDSDHGFNADYRPSYNKTDAEDGWKRLLAWFKANGVA